MTKHSGAISPFIGTDKDEKFAMFIFAVIGEMHKMFIFTDKEGFVEVNDTCPNIMLTNSAFWSN